MERVHREGSGAVSEQRRLPLNFYWVKEGLAGSGHPGWRADVVDETLAAIQQEGIHLIVSLAPLDGAAVSRAGLAHVALDCPDMGVPDASEMGAAVDMARRCLHEGKKVLVHCGAGYGRTGTFLACLLVSDGMAPGEAMDVVRRRRPGSIETHGQEAFVHAWGRRAGR